MAVFLPFLDCYKQVKKIFHLQSETVGHIAHACDKREVDHVVNDMRGDIYRRVLNEYLSSTRLDITRIKEVSLSSLVLEKIHEDETQNNNMRLWSIVCPRRYFKDLEYLPIAVKLFSHPMYMLGEEPDDVYVFHHGQYAFFMDGMTRKTTLETDTLDLTTPTEVCLSFRWHVVDRHQYSTTELEKTCLCANRYGGMGW